MKEKVTLLELFITFAKVGVMTFGGGLSMLPILQKEIVESKSWATEDELTDYFAIGQCTPGIIAVNTATFIGHKTRGNIGGIFATLGMIFPSLITITALAGVISLLSENIYVQKAFIGIRIGVCVLVLNTLVKLTKSALKGKLTITVFCIVAILAIIFNTSPITIVLCVIVFSIIMCITGIEREKTDV